MLILLYGWAPLPKGAHLPQRLPITYIQALQQGLSGRCCVCRRHGQRQEGGPEAGEKDHSPQSGFLEAEAGIVPRRRLNGAFCFGVESQGLLWGDRKACISRLWLRREKPAWIPALASSSMGLGCLS